MSIRRCESKLYEVASFQQLSQLAPLIKIKTFYYFLWLIFKEKILNLHRIAAHFANQSHTWTYTHYQYLTLHSGLPSCLKVISQALDPCHPTRHTPNREALEKSTLK
jgi:hypothetical protein